MRRVLLAVTGTIAGLVALLSFKTHAAITGQALPQASLPGSSSTSSDSASSGAASSGAASSGAASSGAASSGVTSSGAPSSGPPSPGSSSASGTPAPSSPSSSAASQTYTGQAISTRYGVVQVRITVRAKRITNAAFVQLTAFDGHSADINAQAGPILLEQTLSAQSAQIDGVSGATFTTDGYEQSLQSALDQAGI
ncbi:FMN-binding protein [Jatrophihabitans telluris]|uniref:FMN-binding protein n=1 Tax=Jatrophihabitans telluris TaxID=2038343 RepID=A0ABY4QYF3_9ACTN|nr:FMN-binding protein [Jatrophihabitans telluris]UQX88237.1 FMN-binding protein [Jatrophihabitans telluris]